MKVLELKTNKTIEVNDSYGERLIQHGMAILPPGVTAPKADREPPVKEPTVKERKKALDANAASNAVEPKNQSNGDKAS